MVHIWICLTRRLRSDASGVAVSLPPPPPAMEAEAPAPRIEPLEERAHPGIVWGS